MIPTKYFRFVLIFFMTIMMGLTMTFYAELINGPDLMTTPFEFLSSWLLHFLHAYPMILPTVLVLQPLAMLLARKCVKNAPF